jgi:LEA14-like dessication related protein
MILLGGCQSVAPLTTQPEPPEVLLVNILPLDTTMFEQRLQVDLRIRNPNDFDLEITGLDFTLHLNEQQLARGLTNKSATIPRLGDSIISVETTTSTLDVLRQLLNFRQHQTMVYQVTGVVHVQGARLPFERKGTLIDAEQFSELSPTP